MTGWVSLKIIGEELNFDEIAKNINLFPSKNFRRGVTYNKFVGPAENDSWYYTIEFSNESLDDVLKEFLVILNSYEEYIKNLAKKEYVSIRFAVDSPFAQLFFYISPESIATLMNLEIGLEISVFSWGGVESESGVKPVMDLLADKV